LAKTLTQPKLAIESDTKTLLTSTAITSDTSVSRRCGMWSGYGNSPRRDVAATIKAAEKQASQKRTEKHADAKPHHHAKPHARREAHKEKHKKERPSRVARTRLAPGAQTGFPVDLPSSTPGGGSNAGAATASQQDFR